MMTAPRLSVVDFSGGAGTDLPLLVLGPSLGTSVRHLWQHCAELLHGDFRVIGWDLPGHGVSEPATGFDLAALGESALAVVDELSPAMSFHYAGDSLGGAVGLQLLLEVPDRVASATLLCTGPRIGEPDGGDVGHDACPRMSSYCSATAARRMASIAERTACCARAG